MDNVFSKLRPWQIPIVEQTISGLQSGNFLNASDLGTGKCHRAGDRVILYNGTIKNVENIRVGDELMGDDSTPRRVLSLATGMDELFEIRPIKGESMFVNSEHILSVILTPRRGDNSKIDISVKDFISQNKTFQSRAKLYRVSVEWPETPPLIDPYWLGLWLGDGNSHNLTITTPDEEVVKAQHVMASTWGLSVKVINIPGNKAKGYAISKDNHPRCVNPLLIMMRSYGLCGDEEKHIPWQFLRNSRRVRESLLSGLIDSDGHRYNNGGYEIVSVRENFADQIVFLARSLGFLASKNSKMGTIKSRGFSGQYWRVNLSGVHNLPIRIKRKQSNEPRKQIKNLLVSGFSVLPIGWGRYYGFTLTGNRRYLMQDFTVTHNTYCAVATAIILKRPLLAVCRIGARDTWREVGEHFGFDLSKIETVNRESLRTGNTKYGHWEEGERNFNTGKRAKKFVWTIPLDTLLVMDEIHWDSGMDSLNAKVLRGAVECGLTILGLSGTAAADPRKMRAIGYMLGLHQWMNFPQWLSKYGADMDSWDCGLTPETLDNRPGRELLKRKRFEAMARIHQQMKSVGRFVRLRKSGIPGFPKFSIVPKCVDFNSEELRSILAEMNNELARLRAKSGNPRKEQREIMVRALQKAELLMVPGIVAECEDAIEEGHSVPIFVQFTETVKALASRLKTDCLYTGHESPEVREKNRLRFQENFERKIILNVGAGSESIGLQDLTGEYPRLGLATPTFNAVQFNQMLGRIIRDGAMSPSIWRLIFPAGTILEGAYHACKAKTERIDAFNGDTVFDDDDLTAGLSL